MYGVVRTHQCAASMTREEKPSIGGVSVLGLRNFADLSRHRLLTRLLGTSGSLFRARGPAPFRVLWVWVKS